MFRTPPALKSCNPLDLLKLGAQRALQRGVSTSTKNILTKMGAQRESAGKALHSLPVGEASVLGLKARRRIGAGPGLLRS